MWTDLCHDLFLAETDVAGLLLTSHLGQAMGCDVAAMEDVCKGTSGIGGQLERLAVGQKLIQEVVLYGRSTVGLREQHGTDR